MFKCLAVWMLAALALQAQSIDAGSPADAGFQGGLVWNASSAGYVDLGAAPWTDLRYSNGTIPFSYSIAAPNGFYRVRFSLMEPNKAAAGQRSFTITANGQSSAALDLFKLAGLRTQYTLDMFVPVNNGVLSIVFRSTLGNAVVSAIEASPFRPALPTISQLMSGPLVGKSIKTADGVYLDTYDRTYSEWFAKQPECDERLFGVFRLVDGKFGICWQKNGAFQWMTELPSMPIPGVPAQ